MQIRVKIAPDGQAQVESLSALEDLWHDFQFFHRKGTELDHPSASVPDRLIAKRYYRAALLTLVFYLEGVVNHWLSRLLPHGEWVSAERQCLEKKIDYIQAYLPNGDTVKPEIEEAKRLRNMLAHLKPARDSELYDRITGQMIDETQASVNAWLSIIENTLQVQRHPDTRLVSRNLTETLGLPVTGTEGYTGG